MLQDVADIQLKQDLDVLRVGWHHDVGWMLHQSLLIFSQHHKALQWPPHSGFLSYLPSCHQVGSLYESRNQPLSAVAAPGLPSPPFRLGQEEPHRALFVASLFLVPMASNLIAISAMACHVLDLVASLLLVNSFFLGP